MDANYIKPGKKICATLACDSEVSINLVKMQNFNDMSHDIFCTSACQNREKLHDCALWFMVKIIEKTLSVFAKQFVWSHKQFQLSVGLSKKLCINKLLNASLHETQTGTHTHLIFAIRMMLNWGFISSFVSGQIP